jgi:hypothetical protein
VGLISKLQKIRDIREGSDNVRLSFADGTWGDVEKTDPNLEEYMRLARNSVDTGRPVGIVSLSTPRISEVVWVDNDIVVRVLDASKDALKVWFQRHHGGYFLRLDHPEFGRLTALLQHSLADKKPVWFVPNLNTLTLEDVMLAD